MTAAYDVIVIGGGHNGLVTAAYLAKAGRRVLVLEGGPTLGGAARTLELWPGFRVNTGSPEVSRFHPRIIADLGLEGHGLELLESPAAATALLPRGGAITLWNDLERTQAELARRSTRDAEAYGRFAAFIAPFAEIIADVRLRIPPEPTALGASDLLAWVRPALKARRLGRRGMMEFLRMLPMSVAELLDEWFEDEALKGALASFGVAAGDQGPRASGTAFTYLYHLAGTESSPAPRFRAARGGTGALSEALAAAASAHGAEIRTRAPARRILVQDGRVAGVELAEGTVIEARAVASSADPRRTLLDLVGPQQLEVRALRAARNIRARGTTALVLLALSGLPDFGVDAEALAGRLLIAPSLDYLERAHDEAKYGAYSSAPRLEITIPTVLDPGLAPPGQHLMTITFQYAPYALRAGTWDRHRERLGDQAVRTLAEFAPEIKGQIRHRRVLTPLDLEREVGLTGGDIYHGQMGLDQLLFMRPLAGYGRYRMPVEGLYLCGSGAHPGGGVTGAPGYNAARAMLARP